MERAATRFSSSIKVHQQCSIGAPTFTQKSINKYYEYDKGTKLPKDKSRYDCGDMSSPSYYIENTNSKCINLITSLKDIVSNLGDYVDDKKDPATTPPVILPVICKEYKDEDWVVIGGASFRCRQCAFVGNADHTGLHWSAICNKMNCKGLVFKKLDYDAN